MGHCPQFQISLGVTERRNGWSVLRDQCLQGPFLSLGCGSFASSPKRAPWGALDPRLNPASPSSCSAPPRLSPLSVVQKRLLGPLLLLQVTWHTAQRRATGEGQQQAARQHQSQSPGAHLPAGPCWKHTGRARAGAGPAEKQARAVARPTKPERSSHGSFWEGDPTHLHSHSHTPAPSPHAHPRPLTSARATHTRMYAQYSCAVVHTYTHTLSHVTHSFT